MSALAIKQHNMETLVWATTQKRVNDLIPQSVNPRTINNKQMADLKLSLKRFNLVEIPAIDADSTILAGHQRIKALQLIGRGDELIDVRIPNRKLTDEESRRYLLSSNALGGDWDYELLKSFDLDLLLDVGFDEIELSKFWDNDVMSIDDNFDPEKELKKIKATDIKRGDLLILGKHKLLCGDATDPLAVQAVFSDERTSMIYSDPIYNIGLDYNKGVGNKANYGGTVDDNKSAEEYKTFIRKSLEAALSVSTPDTHTFYWCDEAWVWLFQTLYNELGIKNRRLNIWLKNSASPTPMVAFNKAIEFCVYGTLGSPYLAPHSTDCTEVMNADVRVGNELVNVWAEKRIKMSEYEHPTSKPPSLHEKAIKRCSKPNDIILDSFSGSASTMICAESLKRRVYSFDIEPIFCELARRRYEKFTGNKVEIIRNFYEKA